MSEAPLPAVVVIGLDCITGLQTARILATRGVPVFGIAQDPAHFSCRTRVCERILQADLGSAALIPVLVELAQELDARAVLCPCTDAAVLVLSEHREELRIIPDELWLRVQRIVEGRSSPKSRPGTRSRYLLSGLLQCSECEGGFHTLDHEMWGCGNRQRGGICANDLRVPREDLEAAVIEQVQRIVTPSVVTALFERVLEELSTPQHRAPLEK